MVGLGEETGLVLRDVVGSYYMGCLYTMILNTIIIRSYATSHRTAGWISLSVSCLWCASNFLPKPT